MNYKIWIKEMRERLQDLHVPEGAIHIDIVFVIKRPKRLKKGGREIHSKRPDIDNMVKSVLDALPIKDDAVVTSLTAAKFYAAFGEDPNIELHIKTAEKKILR
jgi:Holliday junction resolvase RusA-like endonuclease